MGLEGRDERFAELAYLPATELRHLFELLHRARVSPCDRFHAIARAEDARIELEALGGGVTRCLECTDARVELRVAIPTCGARKLRQLGVGHGERALYRIQDLAATLL